MTYEEAINEREIKHGLNNYFINKGTYYEYAIIAPMLLDDWKRFYSVFQNDFSLYNDELAKEYSSDNSFRVRYQVVKDPNL